MDTQTWRIIRSEPANGAWNMAMDEAILESVIEGKSSPTLRLYAWKPPCLSLGYAQPYTEAYRIALENNGWDVVRRPTGGRAILHADELTYSVIAPDGNPIVRGDLLESYKRISQALIRALEILGIPVSADKEYNPQNSIDDKQKGPVCFEVPSNYEITFKDKKLIGSAQARRKGGILQHGTFPLFGDLTRITRVLNFISEEKRQLAAQRLLDRAITAEYALGRKPSWDEAANAFETGFIEIHQVHFEASAPTPTEMRRADQLVEQKYAHPQWTKRL